MIGRLIASLGVLAAGLALGFLAPAATAGQPQTPTAETWTPPRTPWGDPDLQGIWDYRTLTPLERPSGTERRATSCEQFFLHV